MQLRAYLSEIAATYDRAAGMGSPAQLLLRTASAELRGYAPAGFVVKGSGGAGTATFSPWIGFFDPDETITPQQGIYLVYLYSADLAAVTLTLQQGITKLTRTLGRAKARARLAVDAAAIRRELPDDLLAGTDAELDLGSEGYRQRAYEAGNIASVRYLVPSLPEESDLERDLAHLFDAYQEAVVVKRQLLQSNPGLLATSSVLQLTSAADPLRHFEPKSDADYVAHIVGRRVRKSRRHETLVREYGEWANSASFEPSTPHPLDLVLTKGTLRWLVEAKVVYSGNATEAVRTAVGQLLCYRHFHYGDSPVRLVALFSESVGAAYIHFLQSCGVASVWRYGADWLACSIGAEDGLGLL
jgi:hypothetical protein